MPTIKHLPSNTDSQIISSILAEDGALILDNVVSDAFIASLREETDPYMLGTSNGADDFSGFKTTRTGGLLSRSEKMPGIDYPARYPFSLRNVFGAFL